MPTKSELLQTHRWSELTAAERERFKDRATFQRRRQEYLASLDKPTPTPAPAPAPAPTPTPTRTLANPFGISNFPTYSGIYGPANPAVTPAATPVSNPFFPTIPPSVAAPTKPTTTTTPKTQEIVVDPPDPPPIVQPPPSEPPLTRWKPEPPTPAPDPIPEDIPPPKFDDSELRNQISDLQNIINSMPTTSDFNDLKSGYETDIGNLQSSISGYQSQIGGFQSTISSLSDQLRAAQEKANQFKIRDTQYVGNNNSQGIRLKRSKVFDSGAFAFGTKQLNRDFKSPLSISNINL